MNTTEQSSNYQNLQDMSVTEIPPTYVVKGNSMVDMQLTNHKLVGRGARMIMDEVGIKDYDLAETLLLRYGSVRKAVSAYLNGGKYED